LRLARARRSLSELGAGAPLAAVALLAANDHLLKRALPGAVSGKLSDVAICFLLPLLVSAALGAAGDWPARRRLWAGAAVTTVVFALLEMSDAAGALYGGAVRALGLGSGRLTRDPTDLAALLFVPLAVAHGLRRARAAGAPASRTAGAAVLIGGALALMADSPPSKCDLYSAPVVFQADPGCGPGGIIVVEADEYLGRLSITNAAALGIHGVTTEHYDRYMGDACPYTLANGEWEVTRTDCPDLAGDGGAGADAGVDGGADAGLARPTPCTQVTTCQAVLESGTLWFSCGGGDAQAPACRSRLTEVP
jgi:hypothetical protein